MATPLTSSGAALLAALLKLIDAVEEENSALREQQILSHAAFTDRKNQALRELMAAQRMEMQPATLAGIRPLLYRLSSSLQDNSRLLKLHIAAVGEISDIIVGSLRDAESDGTYSRGRAHRSW